MVYLWERQWEQGGGGQRNSSRLHAESSDQMQGEAQTHEPNCEIMSWAKVRHLTNWASQVPLKFRVFFLLFRYSEVNRSRKWLTLKRLFLTVPKREGHPGHRGHMEKCQGWLGGREPGGNVGKGFYCGSQGRQGKAGQTGLGLASLSNFSRLWGVELALSLSLSLTFSLSLIAWYLALGWLQQRNSGPESESPMEEVVGVWALD